MTPQQPEPVRSVDFIALVREHFPEVTTEEALFILWNYTGYPSFWDGDPPVVCREQLAYLKEVGAHVVDTNADFEAMVHDPTSSETSS